jgi:hypothetical protein
MASAATRVFPSAMESMIVVASNRGPVSFDHDAAGALTSSAAPVARHSALRGVLPRRDDVGGAAMTEGDREVAVEGYELDPESRQRVRFVSCHLSDTTRTTTRWPTGSCGSSPLPVGHRSDAGLRRTTETIWHEFVEANRSFALALAEEGDRDPRLPDPGLPPRPRARHVARAPSGCAHRPLSRTRRSRGDVPAHPAVAHARRDPAWDGGRRRRRVPVASVGRELPPVRAGLPGARVCAEVAS